MLSSSSARFTAADSGKPITIPGAGPGAMLGAGIRAGSLTERRVSFTLERPVVTPAPIIARYWTATSPLVKNSGSCSIAAGSPMLTCRAQRFTSQVLWAIAAVSGSGPRDAGARPALVGRIIAVTPTVLKLDRQAIRSLPNGKLTIWLRYVEPHGRIAPGQTRVAFELNHRPLPNSLTVSAGSIDATEVAHTDLVSTIRSVSQGRVLLADRASSTVRSGTCWFGTDDWKAFQSALDAAAQGPVSMGWPWEVASAGNGRVEVPGRRAYYIGRPLAYSGANLELRAWGAPIYYGGSGTFLRMGAAARSGACPKSKLTARYHVEGLFVIGSFNAAVGVALPCTGQARIENSLIQGFVENLDVGLPGASGTSPDTKIIGTFLDRGVTNLWVHTADLFELSGGGYYGYRDRGMVLCADQNPDTLCHSLRVESAEGASHYLSSVAGLDAGNIDGFEFRSIYDEPGVVAGTPEGAGAALRFGYNGSPHGGIVTGGTWSGNKVDTAVEFNAPGSSGVKSDISFFGNYLVNWNIGFDLSSAKNIFAGPNRFEPGTITGSRYAGIDRSDWIMDEDFKGAARPTVEGAAPGGVFSLAPVFSAAANPLPPCSSQTRHWRACVSDAPACVSGKIYAGGGGSSACEMWCNGTNWIQSGSGC